MQRLAKAWPILVLLAGAAAVLVWQAQRGSAPTLAVSRSIEARLTWPPAAAHRPYAPAGAEPGLADLREPAALLLGGDAARALAGLEGQAGADAASDRAAVLLVLGRAEEALVASDAALDTSPDHHAARWNRALALTALGLGGAAARELERVARAGEPGWSQEAALRAGLLEQARAARALIAAPPDDEPVRAARGALWRGDRGDAGRLALVALRAAHAAGHDERPALAILVKAEGALGRAASEELAALATARP